LTGAKGEIFCFLTSFFLLFEDKEYVQEINKKTKTNPNKIRPIVLSLKCINKLFHTEVIFQNELVYY
jgi:hypothetical protein